MFCSGTLTGLSRRVWGVWGSRSLLGGLRDAVMGVTVGSFWFATGCLDFLALNTGGGGRPSQPRSRNVTIS